jgi:hypothetical protein
MDQYMADRREREEDNARAYVKWYTSGRSEHGTGQFDAQRAKNYLGQEMEKESGDTNPSGSQGVSGPMGTAEGAIVGSVIGSSAVAALNAYAISQTGNEAAINSQTNPMAYSEFSTGGDGGTGGNVGAGLGAAGGSVGAGSR